MTVQYRPGHDNPATVFFGRSLKNRLPQVNTSLEDGEIRQHDTKAKAKMKSYADARIHAKPSTLGVGDAVLVKNSSISKSQTPYQPEPLVVTQKKGSMITASRDGATVTRNSSFFKRSPCSAAAGPPAAQDLIDVPVITPSPDPVSEEPAPPTPSPSPQAALQPRNTSSPASPLLNPGLARSCPTPQPSHGRPQRQIKAPGYLRDYTCN